MRKIILEEKGDISIHQVLIHSHPAIGVLRLVDNENGRKPTRFLILNAGVPGCVYCLLDEWGYITNFSPSTIYIPYDAIKKINIELQPVEFYHFNDWAEAFLWLSGKGA